ncbi:uncharacterized protein N7506_005630 [Penicillium brevicompactum]|uniref:uncharacterized protein n=1 Tax=Penicillium brevicompactum TaxID=5074 RepID=UPI002541A29B|nr:uncharacterized protein N7506_005630 [Penicillium brevicompactum]KAJ5335694.1 hypothetical protein N7506_005630 [Penicillium brevicompactum]
MSTFEPGNFELWQRAGAVQTVPMGGIQFLDFRQKAALATAGLGSCSAVVIASPHGVILAHIAPLPVSTQNPFAGDANVQSTMNRVVALYQEKKRDFFPSAETVVICAEFRGEVALPDQLAIMTGTLNQVQLQPRAISYSVPTNPSTRDNGVVMIIKKPEYPQPKIYVQDRVVN